MREKITFLDFTFCRIVSLVSSFFFSSSPNPVLEPITPFYILRWPDCPDSGTTTAPLCRWEEVSYEGLLGGEVVSLRGVVMCLLFVWWWVGKGVEEQFA
jgi:hypothetical protein